MMYFYLKEIFKSKTGITTAKYNEHYHKQIAPDIRMIRLYKVFEGGWRPHRNPIIYVLSKRKFRSKMNEWNRFKFN